MLAVDDEDGVHGRQSSLILQENMTSPSGGADPGRDGYGNATLNTSGLKIGEI